MNQTNIKFEIENPYTGDSIVLNDVTTDPSKVYTITESPISKLDVRTAETNRLGRHFVKTEFSFYGRRDLVFKGQIAVFTGSESDIEEMMADMKKVLALPALPNANNNGFVVVKWTDERGLAWQTNAKVTQDVEIKAVFGVPFVKEYTISLMCEDGIIYSQNTLSSSVDTAYYGGNLILPTILPATIESVWWNEMIANNAGNFTSPPVFRIYGEAVNPKITHVEDDIFIFLDGYTVPTGRYVEIDVAEGTIELDDGTDLSGYLSTDSTWIQLNPGNNTLRLEHDGDILNGMLACDWHNTEI